MAHLVFAKGKTPLFQVRLSGASTKIGRSFRCDVVLSEPEISREHAILHQVDQKYFLKKLGKQAITVNGEALDQKVLEEGDCFRIGPWEITLEAGKVLPWGEPETKVSEAPGDQTQTVAQSSRGLLVQKLALQVHQPNQAPRQISLEERSLHVGAAQGNDVVLEDPYVSSRHLKISIEDGRVLVHDLGSTNGTFLNGVKVGEAQWEPGAPLKVGQAQLDLVTEDEGKGLEPLTTDNFCGMAGGSEKMQKLYGVLGRIGPTSETVLVLGESGVGKELVARAIHDLSDRRKGPFVALNCGAIAKDLIESELFGHEKGAFTGALGRHEGAFAQAQGGTLFLDEIAELPLDLQPKLLRVLENKSFRRVGGSEELKTDVRVVAATHRDLAQRVQNKQFRQDLFFRLFVFPIQVPALRERPGDIPLLAQVFLKEFATGSSIPVLSESALKKLREHKYPGNVRELRNILLRAGLLSEGHEIKAENLLFSDDFSSSGDREDTFSGVQKLEEVERKMIQRALEANQWNKAKTAEALGIAKSTLFLKIKLYDLKDQQEK